MLYIRRYLFLTPPPLSSIKVSLFGTWGGGLGKGVEAEKEKGQRRTERERREKEGMRLAENTWGKRKELDS